MSSDYTAPPNQVTGTSKVTGGVQVFSATANPVASNTLLSDGSSANPILLTDSGGGLVAQIPITGQGFTLKNQGGTALITVAPTGNESMAGVFTSYGGQTVVNEGVAAIVAATVSKSETSAADASILTFAPPAVAGVYRISVQVDTSAAQSAGSVGYTVAWTDQGGNAIAATPFTIFVDGTANGGLTLSVTGIHHCTSTALIATDNSQANIIVAWHGGGTTTVAKATVFIERLA